MDVRRGYKRTEAGVIPQEWESTVVGKVIHLRRGHDLTEKQRRQGPFPIMGSAGQNGFHDIAIAKAPGVVLGRSGASFGQAHFCEHDYWPHNTALYVTDFRGNDPKFVFYFLKNVDFSSHNSGGAQQSLNRNFIAPLAVALPRLPEQKAIAKALADADALIGALETLIAKKRDVKQGTMQGLLTGQCRLPGFESEWHDQAVGTITIISKGQQIDGVKIKEGGMYPHYNGGIGPSNYTDETNFKSDTVTISEGGNSCRFVNCINTPFWCGGHCYALESVGISNRFLYYALKVQEASIKGLRVGSGLPNIQKTAISKFRVLVPDSDAEQRAIASVLSDMDAEIAALEDKLAKERAVKQGMMQVLLSGEVRLV